MSYSVEPSNFRLGCPPSKSYVGSNLRHLEASVKAVKAPGRRISPMRIYAAIHMDFQPPEIFSVETSSLLMSTLVVYWLVL